MEAVEAVEAFKEEVKEDSKTKKSFFTLPAIRLSMLNAKRKPSETTCSLTIAPTSPPNTYVSDVYDDA